MTRLLKSQEMRAIEQEAIESGSTTGRQLMEKAALAAVGAILDEWPELQTGSHQAVILCGPGNNGGDGYVVARLLRIKGWSVRVYAYGKQTGLPADAQTARDRWSGNVRDLNEETVDELPLSFRDSEPAPDIIVDAIFGTGLSRPFREPNIVDTVNAIARSDGRTRVVALDMPSGWCADSGTWLGTLEDGFYPTAANLTVAFHAAKRGHYIGDAVNHCGKVCTVDIGLQSKVGVPLVTAPSMARLGKRQGHKFDHGHALVLSGGAGRGGAARLAARGALRCGAGLVTVGCPLEALTENAAQLDAIMLRTVEDGPALDTILQDARISALCLGPGLGDGDREAGLLRSALSSGRPLVLDGDALTLLGRDADMMADLHDKCVLTPHAGEFARLFPDLSDRLNSDAPSYPVYSKIDAAIDAADRAGCVIVLKGPDSIIAGPGGYASLHAAAYARAAPWLATAGSGDVLAGIITGLIARGLAPRTACEIATWLHTECALAFGPGLIAEDLPKMLPRVLSGLATE